MNSPTPDVPNNQSAPSDETQQMQSDRMRAGRMALFVGILIFLGKFAAYALTGSTAVFADAMESTINIVSAGMLILALSIAARSSARTWARSVCACRNHRSSAAAGRRSTRSCVRS